MVASTFLPAHWMSTGEAQVSQGGVHGFLRSSAAAPPHWSPGLGPTETMVSALAESDRTLKLFPGQSCHKYRLRQSVCSSLRLRSLAHRAQVIEARPIRAALSVPGTLSGKWLPSWLRWEDVGGWLLQLRCLQQVRIMQPTQSRGQKRRREGPFLVTSFKLRHQLSFVHTCMHRSSVT